MALIVW